MKKKSERNSLGQSVTKYLSVAHSTLCIMMSGRNRNNKVSSLQKPITFLMY